MAEREELEDVADEIDLWEHFSLDEKKDVIKGAFFSRFEKPERVQRDINRLVLKGGAKPTSEALSSFFADLDSDLNQAITNELDVESKIWLPRRNTDFDSILPSSQQSFAYGSSITNLRVLLMQRVPAGVEQHYKNMLFANVITSLETYLSDYLLSLLDEFPETLTHFVQNDAALQKETLTYSQIYAALQGLKTKIFENLNKVSWHNFKAVKKHYKAAFDLELEFETLLWDSAEIRHDIVHRNGKTVTGQVHEISDLQITMLMDACDKLVYDIDERMQIKVNVMEKERSMSQALEKFRAYAPIGNFRAFGT